MNHLRNIRMEHALWGRALALMMAILAWSATAHAGDRMRLDLEGAAAWQTLNDFAVPGNTGTIVEVDRSSPDPVLAGRATVTIGLGSRWSARLLAAPLRVETTFVPAAPIRFQDATFPAGSPVENEYVFNSYRASIFRRFAAGPNSELRLGVTAKVRDAKIALRSGALHREETDLGFVPLVYAGVRFSPTESFAIDCDVDALGAPQGYAVDAAARLLQSLGPHVEAFVGYRILDGGADVDRVYSFARFHYATAGVALKL